MKAKKRLTVFMGLLFMLLSVAGCAVGQDSNAPISESGEVILTIESSRPSGIAITDGAFYAADDSGSLWEVHWQDTKKLQENDRVNVSYSDLSAYSNREYTVGCWTPKYKVTGEKVEVLQANSVDLPNYTLVPHFTYLKELKTVPLAPYQKDFDMHYYECYSMSVVYENRACDLIDAMDAGLVSVDDILRKAEQDQNDGTIDNVSVKDGGTMLYHYPNYTIIKKNTLSGERDLYIGTPNTETVDFSDIKTTISPQIYRTCVRSCIRFNPGRTAAR